MINAFDGSYVHVILPIGESTFARCTADLFTPGVLTVSSLDDPNGPAMRVYQRGEWESVHVVSGDQTEFGFLAKESK